MMVNVPVRFSSTFSTRVSKASLRGIGVEPESSFARSNQSSDLLTSPPKSCSSTWPSMTMSARPTGEVTASRVTTE